MGCSDGERVLIATSSILFTKRESGAVPTFQLTIMPSKQSVTGEGYTFPAGIANSVISVSHFILGWSA